MYRYAIVFLLVNTYTGTLGIPLQPGITNGLINSLAALANRCENSILADQIKSKLNDCNVTVPPYNERQFDCLIFYDINIQLCEAVANTKLAVGNDQAARIKEEVDVAQLCDNAKGWTVTNIPEYPLFKNTVERVFNSKIACLKVCGVDDDVTSQDSNFFCKYFKWGLEMLAQSTSSAPSQIESDASPLADVAIAKPAQDVQKPVPPVNDQSVSNTIAQNANDSSKVAPTTSILIKQDTVSNDQEKVGKQSLQGLSTVQNVHTDSVVSDKNAGNFDIKVDINEAEIKGAVGQKPEEIAGAENSNPSFEGIEKPLGSDLLSSKKDKPKEESAPEQDIVPASESKPPVKKQQGIEDDYQDSDEGREGIDTQGGDDGDDPILGDLNSKTELEQSKSSSKRIEAPASSYNGEFFPNAFQEGFTDDDDHFFPFFLTAVIVVVVLYILYHNKNKVSKVFLGLIVEGRQPGRRRNSRGHAYRRLDTLEQAMSTNSAAPPSKIIY